MFSAGDSKHTKSFSLCRIDEQEVIMRFALTLILLVSCGIAAAAEVTIERSDANSLNEYFEYSNDEISVSKTGTITVRGKIKNISDTTYDLVVVLITVKDASGTFLSLDTCNAKPITIEPGAASIVRVIMRPKRKHVTPAIIEWSIVSAMKK